MDADLADVTDCEIAVQRLTERDVFSASVEAHEADIQRGIQADVQLQANGVRPPRQMSFGLGLDEFDNQRVAILTDTHQLPVDRPNFAVGLCRLVALAHGLHAGRVFLEIAKPRPADRHPAANRLARFEQRARIGPDQRLIAVHLVTDDVRALLGDHQFGVTVADAPAIKLTELEGFDV